MIFTKYYQCEKIKEDEMGTTYSTHQDDEECIHHYNFIRKLLKETDQL
jgi:hypothetical protein